MKTAHTSRMTSIRATLIFFVALVVGALALLSLGTRPAESQQASSQPLYTVHDLGTLAGGSISYAFGINDAGKVVGYSSPSGNATYHPFLYSVGQMSDLGTLGGTFGIAYGINDADKVVGSVTTSDNPGNMEQHAFLYSDGQMSDLSTLGRSTDYSAATAINNADQMIGQSTLSSDDHQGYNDQEYPFLYSDGMMRDLNSLIPEDSGWVITNVSDINDYGHIVGKGIHEDGREHAILLTPFSGFYQPVDNLPLLNKAKPGKTIPIRFSLGGDKGLDIFASDYPNSAEMLCDSSAPVDGIEETVTGKGGLSYNASTDTYEYAWATSSTWSGCRQFVMKLKDGTVQRANFIFR